ncbi:hypothetical protein Dip510_001510 [Elusimicrobium posterum]|uniref:hypothetical protein n=1 Tax=Elusimicrobium posterum TaxID=3116653 RepID=UPI003C78D99F
MRIKLRFSSGEEFEIEGDREFIEQQKTYLLGLLGKKGSNFAAVTESPAQHPKVEIENPYGEFFTMPDGTRLPVIQPKSVRKTEHGHMFKLPPSLRPAQKNENTAQPEPLNTAVNTPPSPTPLDESTIMARMVWENICHADGDLIIIRRKHKLLTPSYAALVIIAAAKILLRESTYSAINLAKSMKLSAYMGGEGDRLDRIITKELKDGSITFEGSKRSRMYRISDEGFARAFVLAEKITRGNVI